MRFTRAVAVVLLLIYIFLWVLAFNGASSLTPVLAVPLVLALLVAVGVSLNRFMGITPRRQHFEDADDARTDPASTARPSTGTSSTPQTTGADTANGDVADPPE